MEAPFTLRPFGAYEAEYDLILGFANAQVPWDLAGNAEWARQRRAFDERQRRRRHYIATHVPTGTPAGYAGIEQQPAAPDTFRIYLVFDPDRWAWDALGALLHQQLLAAAADLGARTLVCIEYAADARFRAFLEHNGFTLQGSGEYNGFGIVRYERSLTR